MRGLTNGAARAIVASIPNGAVPTSILGAPHIC